MKNILIISLVLLSLAACTKKSAPTQTVTPARNKFLGNWSATEKGSSTTAAQYQVSIEAADNGGNGVAIINLQNFFTVPVSAYAVGDSIYIPVQTVGGYTVFGAGLMSASAAYGQSSIITMSYEILDSTNVIASYGYNGNPPSIW